MWLGCWWIAKRQGEERTGEYGSLAAELVAEGPPAGELPRGGVPVAGNRGAGGGRSRVRGRGRVGHGGRLGPPDRRLLPHHDGHHLRVGGGHDPDAAVALRADPAGQPLRARHRAIDGKQNEKLE